MDFEKIKLIYLPFIGLLYILDLWLIKNIPIPAIIQDSEPNYITFFIAIMIVSLIPFLLTVPFLINKISQYFENPFVSGAFLLILFSGYFFLSIYIFIKTPLITQKKPILYEYCGVNFNIHYREAVAAKDPNICLESGLFSDLRTTKLMNTSEPYCLTPTNKSIFITDNKEPTYLKTACISAMARDLKDVKICDLIKKNNLPYPNRYPYVGIKAGDISGCVEDFNAGKDRNWEF